MKDFVPINGYSPYNILEVDNHLVQKIKIKYDHFADCIFSDSTKCDGDKCKYTYSHFIQILDIIL